MLNTIIDNIKFYNDITLVTIYGINPSQLPLSRIFKEIAVKGINLDMISQTPHLGGEITISFTVPDVFFTSVLEALASFKKHFPSLTTDVSAGNFIVSLHSRIMVDTPGVAAEVFMSFERARVDIKMINTSDMIISCVCDIHDEGAVMDILKNEGLIQPY